MSNKLNLTDPVQTSGTAGKVITSIAKNGEHFGTTNVSIVSTNTPLEDGDQNLHFTRQPTT